MRFLSIPNYLLSYLLYYIMTILTHFALEIFAAYLTPGAIITGSFGCKDLSQKIIKNIMNGGRKCF